MVRAVWNGKVIAESDRTEVVEGDHYFSPEHVRREYLAPSDHHTTCAWRTPPDTIRIQSLLRRTFPAKLLFGKECGSRLESLSLIDGLPA